MMEIKELRIGNYVQLGKSDAMVLSVVFDRTKECLVNGLEIALFSGLELTDSWLESFGFYRLSKTEFIFQKYSIRKERRLDNPAWEIYFHGNDNSFHWIKNERYVHSLQNLIYTLTGTELTPAAGKNK